MVTLPDTMATRTGFKDHVKRIERALQDICPLCRANHLISHQLEYKCFFYYYLRSIKHTFTVLFLSRLFVSTDQHLYISEMIEAYLNA